MAFSLDQKSLRVGPLVARAGLATEAEGIGDLRALLERARQVALDAERRLAEQGRRIAELEALSLTDELTGLFNARGFRTMFGRALRAAARDRHEGVLGYADLDGFKAINDRFGHTAGDAALRHVAGTLQANVRPDDIIARLAGDEFAILLVRSPLAEGCRRLESIEAAIASNPVRIGLHLIPLGASIGAARYGAGSDSDDVLDEADRAMYRRKHRGERDRRAFAVVANTPAA